jgi:hypothetical protein
LILEVFYGRDTEFIGTITVEHSTTYPQAKDLIKPLVQDYVKSVGDMAVGDLLVSGFSILDPDGQLVLGPKAGVRMVYSEAQRNNYKVILRPATWLALCDFEEEEENNLQKSTKLKPLEFVSI